MDIARNFLWPMARAGIEHPVMNRVRLRQKAEVLPYRILICALGTGPGAGFVALLRNHEQPSYSASDLAALTAAVPALKLMLAARLDAATGLLQRPDFEAEVAFRSRSNATACVVYANLDQVHVVNEMSGFEAGDGLIREVGRYWLSRLPPDGSIATHLSGDRFAAVLFGHTLNQARHWADQTREGIEQLDQSRMPVRVTASLGVVELEDAASFQHALAAAETACRVAKERGRNRVEVASLDMFIERAKAETKSSATSVADIAAKGDVKNAAKSAA